MVWIGGDANDTIIRATGAAETIQERAGNDAILAEGGGDLVYDVTGNDSVLATAGRLDRLCGSLRDDALVCSGAKPGAVRISGS